MPLTLATVLAVEMLVSPASTSAQEPAEDRPLALTLENIFREAAGARSVSISPDGHLVAVTAHGPEGSGIYLMPTPSGAGGEARWWRDGHSPAWSPDGSRIAYITEDDLWVAPVDVEVAVRLTEGLEGVRAPAWSPDGGWVAFYSSENRHQDIWVVSSAGNGEPRQLTRAAMALDDPRFEPAWSPDGEAIAYISNAANYWSDDVWLVNVASGETRRLTDSLMASSTPVWSPDGGRIALFGTAKDEYWYQDLAYIYVLDPETPGSERVVEMQVYASDRAMRNQPFWSGDASTIYFPYVQRGSYDLWTVPADGGVATRVTNLGGAMRSFDATSGSEAFVFVRNGPVEGPEVYFMSAAGGRAQKITEFAAEWVGLLPPREIAYRTFDGLYIQGFLYLPPRARHARACPALVQVHGGGTNSYLQGLNLIEQYLASKGYVVLAINYRGGSGFGRAFQDLAVEDWLGDQALDAGAAADYLRSIPFVNGEVGIYGGSYGGSMTMAAITRTPDKFDAAVAMRGAYTESVTFDTQDRLGKIFTKTGHGGLPEERPDIYSKTDLLARLESITAPLLLMHGKLDRRVPFVNFELAVAELTRLGKAFESHSYPDEGHGFDDPNNRTDMYQRLEDFFARHLDACGAS